MSSSALTLLIGALSGYLLLSRQYLFSSRYRRLPGHAIFFEATCFSLVFLIPARVSCYLLSKAAPAVYFHWHQIIPIPWLGTVLVSVLVSASIVYLSNRLLPRLKFLSYKNAFIKAAEELGSEFEKIVIETVLEETLLQVTLENRKFYIGRALFPSLQNGEMRSLELIPLFSGHRRDSDLRMSITNNYTDTYLELLGVPRDGNMSPELLRKMARLRILIPVGRIVSLTPFSQEFFDLAQRNSGGGEATEERLPLPESGTSAGREGSVEPPSSRPGSLWAAILVLVEALARKLRTEPPSRDAS